MRGNVPVSDVLITIRLPQELAAKAKAANVEIEPFLLDSLRHKLRDDVDPVPLQPKNRMPTREEVEVEIRKSSERLARHGSV